jgi:hypothetical protein
MLVLLAVGAEVGHRQLKAEIYQRIFKRRKSIVSVAAFFKIVHELNTLVRAKALCRA